MRENLRDIPVRDPESKNLPEVDLQRKSRSLPKRWLNQSVLT